MKYAIIILLSFLFVTLYKLYTERKQHKIEIEISRKTALNKSRSVIRGQVTEELIPLFPDFPYVLSDIKFSGQPIDYIVYHNMSKLRDDGHVEIEIIFADVKVNSARTTKVQNAIKDAIKNKRFRFETWQSIDNKIIIK